MTLHMPGKVGTGGVTGEGARFMILLQSALGQAMRCEDDLQINKQLQGQRTYFFPGGAFLIGCKTKKDKVRQSCDSHICLYKQSKYNNKIYKNLNMYSSFVKFL